jgi:integrase
MPVGISCRNLNRISNRLRLTSFANGGRTTKTAIKWEDVDFDKRQVSIYATKTKHWRQVPISEEFKQKLLAKKAEAQSAYVIEYKGHPISSMEEAFRTARRKAQLPYHCIMYDIRHLFATSMLRAGGDLAAVSKLLGHASIKMTADVYYEVMQGERERAVSLLPQLTEE